ncbi:MAG: DUF1801 domain-containing protein [Silicimonas sp.]|nr:DUF1801 domain-containing protein [Silicimonas sp.]
MSAPTPNVARVFDAAPDAIRERLLAIRGLIFAAAEAEAIGPLEETLKWGEPAYLPQRARIGTTLRLGWSDGPNARVTLFVHCQTTLIDTYRARFSEGFVFEGNRAVHLAQDAPLPEAEVQQMAALALTYHRAKRSAG